MNTLVNTTVLSNFASTQCLDLLRLADGWLRLLTMTDDELPIFASLPLHLHPAERTCLSIARRRGWGFLSDDRAARQQALTWKIPLSGTIGVLLLAIRDRRLTIERGNVLLHEMVVRANYRTPTMDLGEILRLSDQPSAT